jgi:hypothetical protein
LGEVFPGLADANYKGPMVVKSFPAVNPDLRGNQTVETTNPILRIPGEEGLRFLKEHVEEYGLGDWLM